MKMEGPWLRCISPKLIFTMFVENMVLRRQVMHDPLTKLLNRRGFAEVYNSIFANALRYRHPLCVVMADVDHFKKTNDTYGHAAGDKVLRLTAEIMKRSLRGSDIVARYGGEEFILILDLTPSDGGAPDPRRLRDSALVPLERIRRNIEQAAVPSSKGAVKTTVSIGFFVFDPLDLSNRLSANMQERLKDSLVRMADEKLYRAKQAGRNRIEG